MDVVVVECLIFIFQEKTDEVTNKYLERRKLDQEPFSANIEAHEEKLFPRARSPIHHGKKRTYTSAAAKKSYRHEDPDVSLTEDEMSVNTINKYILICFSSAIKHIELNVAFQE